MARFGSLKPGSTPERLDQATLVTVAEDTPEETPATKQARAFLNRLSGRF